jgi:putative transposase
VSRFVTAYRHHGVEPICRVLSTEEHRIAPSSVRSALRRPTCAHRLEDDELKPVIAAIFADNYEVYGARKIKATLKREHGLIVDRARVTRLMSELEIRGAARSRTMRTTRPDKSSPRAPDLVKRQFVAERPNELWVSDFTYVATWSGFVYVAFIIDVHSRFVVGWRVSSTMTTDLVMDALEMAVFNRRTRLVNDVIAHSDAGSQYTSILYTERLAEIGARPSIGTIGDSYDNALAESMNGLYKTELIRRRGPWRNAEHLEIETLAYIEWFNHRRLHGELDHVPPAEHEVDYYDRHRHQATDQTPTLT